MQRDLARFLDHTHQHVIDKIKAKHPEWQASDGTCEPCQVYYQNQLSGDASAVNIGAREQARRYFLGAIMILAGMAILATLNSNNAPRGYRILLFPTAFLSLFGFLQARQKTCAVLSEMGLRNMGQGNEKISDPSLTQALKIRGRNIILHSLIGSAILTAIFLFVP